MPIGTEDGLHYESEAHFQAGIPAEGKSQEGPLPTLPGVENNAPTGFPGQNNPILGATSPYAMSLFDQPQQLPGYVHQPERPPAVDLPALGKAALGAVGFQEASPEGPRPFPSDELVDTTAMFGAAGPIQKGIQTAITAVPKLSAGLMAAAIAAYPSFAGERSNKNLEWWVTPRDPEPELPKFEESPFFPPKTDEPVLSPEEELMFQPKGQKTSEPKRFKGESREDFQKRKDKFTLESKKIDTTAEIEVKKARDDFLQRRIERWNLDHEKLLSSRKADYNSFVEREHSKWDTKQRELNEEDDKFRIRNQSFADDHPAFAVGFPILMGALGGAFTFRSRRQIQAVANDAANEYRKIMAGAEEALANKNYPNLIGSSKGLESALREAKLIPTDLSWKETAMKMAFTGTLAGYGTVFPYNMDLIFKPEGSYAREQANILEHPENYAKRFGVGFLEGALGSLGGRAEIPVKQTRIPIQEMKTKLSTTKQAIKDFENELAKMEEKGVTAANINEFKAARTIGEYWGNLTAKP